MNPSKHSVLKTQSLNLSAGYIYISRMIVTILFFIMETLCGFFRAGTGSSNVTLLLGLKILTDIIANRDELWAERPGFDSLQGRGFSFLYSVETDSRAHASNGYRRLFLWR
jgi:hypothetical protein